MMDASNEHRDKITIENERGEQLQYTIEALFDMEQQSYALLHSEEDLLLMRIEEEDGEQYLVGIDDPEEAQSVMEAYQIAVEAAPADKH